jgi:hypothetical protein
VTKFILFVSILIHGTAFAGGGGAGGYEVVEAEQLLVCEGKDVSVEIWRESRSYDDDGGTDTFVLEAKSKPVDVFLETPDLKELFNPEKPFVKSKLSYLRDDGDNTVTLDGAYLESNLAIDKAGEIQIWKYDYDTGKKGAQLISLHLSTCRKP